jgi:hypothetical protein
MYTRMKLKTYTSYKELEMAAILKDVPELGIETGVMGTIATVYAGAGCSMLRLAARTAAPSRS